MGWLGRLSLPCSLNYNFFYATAHDFLFSCLFLYLYREEKRHTTASQGNKIWRQGLCQRMIFGNDKALVLCT